MTWARAKIVLIVVGGGLVSLLVLALIVSRQPPEPRRTLGERAKIACDKQFGPGTGESLDCQIAIMSGRIRRDHEERLRRATAEAE